MESKRLDKAAQAAGIAAEYINAHGKPQEIPADTKQRLLDAMNHTPAQRGHGDGPVPATRVITQAKKMVLSVAGKGEYHWILTTEQGQQHRGEVQGRSQLLLPASLPTGYHTLTLTQGESRWHCWLIVAPGRCYEPASLQAGQKLWGACVQLYTLRSARNWGIGDFGDLRQMVIEVAARGGAFIGLNPIHALYPATPESASPYSPSSRRWMNVIYIDVTEVEDFALSAAARQWWAQPETQQQLQAAREAEWVDYSSVTQLKLSALSMAWTQFLQRSGDDALMAAFRGFIAREGESLFYQAAFDALHAWQMQQDGSRWGWPVWPEAYRDADSPAVAAFCVEHRDQVEFYMWLQWLAWRQFAACWESCQQRNMPIGLYRDLAVGVAEGGAETWRDKALYCLKASVGAPPDILGPLGQNWGLPPMDPHIMVERGYEPFIELLRANMTHCGALRIDHVMSLLRLWWIPYGETADKGAYVHYPVDDLLAILALESQRHQCMVIGEDLGTVPVEIIGKLRDSGIYSYKVLWFEQDGKGRFRAPEDFTVQAMAVASTHDMPTVRGYWEGGDLALGRVLGLYPDAEILAGLYQDRARAKQSLLDSLHQHGCVPQKTGRTASRMKMTAVLNRGLQRYIADSNSALLGLQPEDWLDMATPVNVPGTSDEYKNWRRKLTHSLEAMFDSAQVNRLIKDLDKHRRQRPFVEKQAVAKVAKVVEKVAAQPVRKVKAG
ncbi:4-alpha-glucanotransferase [Shimwellia pseudoproteus]|uniref:4-alpha-glucanotransferase n=1 Tax=Shimwellia pseudoproteus TaxID=570012 RepID=UPI0018EA3831|nr:4-alpha-glucanotransferase [Shimwellia pseudoproteus]MBJ3815618.1 4-alpha-glucanotransferase [Shimwellia pseudoproteus]